MFTFDIASKFWNVTAPGTIFVGWASISGDLPGGPGGPGGPKVTSQQIV